MDRKMGWLTLREWTGLLLLLGLLAGGVLSGQYLTRQYQHLAGQLEEGTRQVLLGRWEEAVQTVETARSHWEKNWHFRASFSDHTPMEEIDDLFAQLEVCEAVGDRPEFAKNCAALASRMEALENSHKLSWWNVL